MAGADYDGRRKTIERMGGGGEAEGGGRVNDRAAGQLGLEMEGAMRSSSTDGCVVGSEGMRLRVLSLLKLELKGVFRTVVGFL